MSSLQLTDEIRQIENALDALLSVAVEEDLRPRPPGGPLRVISFEELAEQPVLSHEQSAVAEIVETPVSGAVRYAIRLLGERIHELTGSTDAMRDIAERVAGRNQSRWGHRIDILDKRWDGIGGWWA
jgi:hypothetical protein